MYKVLLSIYCLISNVCSIQAVNELLKNSDFESTSFSGNWFCADCTFESYTQDKYHGGRSVKITNRHHDWSAPQQSVHVTGGRNYIARTYFKFLNMPSGLAYTKVDYMVAMQVNGKSNYVQISQIPMQQMKFGWTELGGDFHVPNGVSSISLYIQVHNAGINYLQDYTSLKELPHNSNWKSEAIARINKIRKAPVTFKLAPGTNTQGISVEFVQMKRAFAFGTAVNAHFIADSTHAAYQNFVYNNFEWTVLENALKWNIMESNEDRINFNTPVNAIRTLHSHGLKIRGHNMFWDVDKFEPRWLAGKSHTQVLAEMKKHVNDVISHTKGKLEHWDVNNENLHGDYFERHTGDPDITTKMFQWIHALEPNVKLFLNEYDVISGSRTTTALKNQGVQLHRNGVSVYGIGLQSHFFTTNIDMDRIKYRLDKIAESGLKLWITELSVKETDANKKATALENLMTMYFSHPAVEGIMLWGFWDGAIWHKEEALATGNHVSPNAAGQRYMNLYHKTWKTYFNRNVDPGKTVQESVFKGDYLMNVKRNGHLIHQERFTVGSSGKSVIIHLSDNQHVSHIAFG